jgi:hypothetical protein
MSKNEEANKKIKEFGIVYDNRASEYNAKITSMNIEHKSMRYLLVKLAKEGIEKTQSPANINIKLLDRSVSSIIEAIFFLIGSRSHNDFQNEYPNKKVDVADEEYLKQEMEYRNIYSEILNVRSHFCMVVGGKIEIAMYLLSIGTDESGDIDILKGKLKDIFKDVRAHARFSLPDIELP